MRNRRRTVKRGVNVEARDLGLLGKRFGDLVVIRHSRSGRVGAWIAKCDCGRLPLVNDALLKSGDAKNCGCNSDLPPAFVPVFKLELDLVPNCFVSTVAVGSQKTMQPQALEARH